VTTTESRWTDEDRSLLLALLAEEHDECRECGHPRDVSTDRRTQGTWRVHRRVCEACRILEAEVGNDAEAKSPKRGMKYAVVRTTEGV
jgi:hypothetical protein